MSRSWTNNRRRNVKIELEFWKQNSQFLMPHIANPASRILALCSHVCCLSVCVTSYLLSTIWYIKPYKTTYFLKAYDQRQCSQVSESQIHKYIYTNTASIKVADRPNMCYIFEKVMVRGPQKQYSRVSDMQIHKYNNTNTQIQKYSLGQICR